jgi:hypothetical protein
MDQILPYASGATGQDDSHDHTASDDVFERELSQEEAIGSNVIKKEAYMMGLIKSYIDDLDAKDRSDACKDVAGWLWTCWVRDHNNIALMTCIELERGLVDLCPASHPDRARLCTSLGVSLKTRYSQTGETALLDQAIELQKEALDLHHAGHPDRARSCVHLGVSLWTRYRQTGDTALLSKAIELQEEALGLCPAGHPERARSCANLAISLLARYSQTGDDELLNKAIELEEEVLDLHAPGHPDRARSCGNLAASLLARYNHTGVTAILDKAIEFEKEALDLHPTGHPERARSCANLAVSLKTRYKQTGDTALLDNAIELEQEALDLRPAGHPDRATSCTNLANSLKTRYRQTGDTVLLNKALELNQQALLSTTLSDPARWRYSLELATLNQTLSPHLGWQATISHLHQVFNASSYDDISAVLESAVKTLLIISTYSLSLQQQQDLLSLHVRAIDIVTLAAGLALEAPTQLQHTFHGVILGPAALRLAVRLDQLSTGLQLFERARGVIWSQMLHLRDPDLEHVPEELAKQLQSLIRSVAAPQRMSGHSCFDMQPHAMPARSMHYAQRHQLQNVIRQIRSLPNLSDFMRGPDIDTLLEVGAKNAVAVLIADKNACYAILITSGESPLTYVSLPDMSRKALRDLTFEGLTSLRRCALTDVDSIERGMHVSKGATPAHARLAKLWQAVVKPIIEQLSLVVSAHTEHISIIVLTEARRGRKVGPDPGSTGALPVLLPSFQFTLRASTKVRTNSAAPTMSSHRTRQR